MARARNIKPSFFTNEDLVELPYETRLMFIGLWTLADREGRLEDRPKKIKMAIFPGDEIDVDSSLTALHNAKFIIRYGAGTGKYIQIVNFKKHQTPHIKEAHSTIPAPDSHRASPSESPFLNPESPFLNPESNTPQQTALSQEVSTGAVDNSAAPLAESEQPPPKPEPPPEPAPAPQPPTLAGAMAIELRQRGVTITSQDPRLLDWIARGVTIPQAIEAVEIARQSKPATERIAAGYLGAVIEGEILNPKPKAKTGPPWWSSEQATAAKAVELGMTARGGESWDQFRGRIRQRIADQERTTA